ncbi:hypothetical protein THIOM_004957 [Candidatus Thiomargarita nelsonii]|uniref:Uncharacterized protein n=1 Tax=Candidatus Thiomargarita nelsonii TaxID=1003181 RepID=A0A176RUH3_9GAMM|nr:hypothetical protein THIOM_004957 [Candidatus Thiomargarita nelsonii]
MIFNGSCRSHLFADEIANLLDSPMKYFYIPMFVVNSLKIIINQSIEFISLRAMQNIISIFVFEYFLKNFYKTKLLEINA